MELAANVVRCVHLALICYMAAVPFCGNLENMVLVVAGYVALFAHWLLNNDSCTLTLLEQHFRGVPKGETFVQSIVGPMYGLGGSWFIWAASITLFALALVRLRKQLMLRGKHVVV